jgi:DivIVA domain-containing protein
VVTILGVLGVVAVLIVAAVVATRNDELLVDAPPDAPDRGLPPGPVRADDLRRLRFGVTVRGYRMSEVDAVLERLAAELADRDARLSEPAARVAEPAPSGDDGA